MNGRDLMQIATLELILKVLHIIFGNHQLLASKKVLKRNITRLMYLIQFTEVLPKKFAIYRRETTWHTPRESIASFILLKSILNAFDGANQGSPLLCKRKPHIKYSERLCLFHTRCGSSNRKRREERKSYRPSILEDLLHHLLLHKQLWIH